MKRLAAALCLMLAFSPLALAQDKKDAAPKRQPSAAQKKQQERMKECNAKADANKVKGDQRKVFMASCLKGDDDKKDDGKGEKLSAQQEKMRACNKQAGDKKLKGDDRKKFMSGCLKG